MKRPGWRARGKARFMAGLTMIAIVVLVSVCVPILEVMLFAWIIELAGIWPVIVPSAVTGLIGVVILIKSFPGFLDNSLSNDKFQTFPTMQSYFDVTRIVSGILLLIPGFISDLAGLVLMHPRLRGVTFVTLARLMASSRNEDNSLHP